MTSTRPLRASISSNLDGREEHEQSQKPHQGLDMVDLLGPLSDALSPTFQLSVEGEDFTISF